MLGQKVRERLGPGDAEGHHSRRMNFNSFRRVSRDQRESKEPRAREDLRGDQGREANR